MNVAQRTPPLAKCSPIDDERLVGRVEKVEYGGLHGCRAGRSEQRDSTLRLEDRFQTEEKFVGEFRKFFRTIIGYLLLTNGPYMLFNRDGAGCE